SQALEDAEIYLDGFHSFTPKELLVIEALMKKCKRVTVTLTLDQVDQKVPSELDLFYKTAETYHQLKQMTEESEIRVEDSINLDPANGRFKDRPYFAHLEKHFNTIPSPSYEGEVPIRIAEAVHPRAEVEGAAQEIISLVREENYRYQDIALFIRETDS